MGSSQNHLFYINFLLLLNRLVNTIKELYAVEVFEVSNGNEMLELTPISKQPWADESSATVYILSLL